MKNRYLSLNRIKALPKELADKIAAGEVVERPLSIVKELVENSIDAGSFAITVEIKKGGKEYIRVTDNGKGIEKDQLPLAFTRYATSKIATEDDLANILSLGFRGEALASIAAVSKVELISKPADAKVGAKVLYEASEMISLTDASCEDGTTILVRDIFYNLPARKKFLKPDNTESSLIADYLQKMALAYPEVKFRFINNGSILFSTLGKGSLYDAILTLYSPQTAKALVPVDYFQQGLRITGYTSGAELNKTNKRGQVYFVNGRWVKSKVIDSAIEDAYHDKLFEGRYPVCYLFIEIDPSNIDVNVHPSKTEIKFYDEGLVKDFIILGIRKALLAGSAAPNVADIAKETKAEAFKDLEISIKKEEKPLKEEIKASVTSSYENILLSSIFDNMRKTEVEEQIQLKETPKSVEIPMVTEDKEVADNRFKFQSLRFLSQVFTTYLICTDEECLYFIDQHAAHERILYEQLLDKFNGEETASQVLLAPFVLSVTPGEAANFAYWGKLLMDIGFVIEEFGPSQFIVKEIPASLDFEEAEIFAKTVLESDADNPKVFQEKRDKIISASCKAAIKAGDKLSELEVKKLFESLDKCENPFSCPHGRPTFLRFSEYEIERFFKRK